MQGIKNPGHQRNPGNECQIGKCDARQFDGQGKFLRVLGKSRRKDMHCPRHDDFDDRDQKSGNQQQDGHRMGGKLPGDLQTAFFDIPGQKRDERGRKRAFAKQAAKQIGEFKCDKKRVRHAPGAQKGGTQDIPGKSGYTREQGKSTNRGNRTNKGHTGLTLCKWAGGAISDVLATDCASRR